MKLRTVLIVCLALVFGLTAAIFARRLVHPASASEIETVQVVTVAVDIPRFKTVTADLLTTQAWPKDKVPKGVLLTLEDAVGRTAATDLKKDETLLDSRLTVRGAGPGMSSVIPLGMRAYTVPTPNVATGVAGFILPGNKVDVLLTVRNSGVDASGNAGGATGTLLQNLEILAVHQLVNAPADNKVAPKDALSVTLLVTPMQAATLDLAQAKGMLHLTLRNLLDTKDAETRPVRWRDLGLEDNRPTPLPTSSVAPVALAEKKEAPTPSQTMTILNGPRETRIDYFPAGNGKDSISSAAAVVDEKKEK